MSMSVDQILAFTPAFQRYEPRVLHALNRVERARGIIESAQILPAQEDILRRDAESGSVHYSNLIEDNQLPMIEALRAVEGDLQPTDKSKLELVNYVAALRFIEESHRRGEISYTPEFIKNLHGVMTKGLGRPPDANGRGFQPHHEGEWRDGQVYVGGAITGTVHTPPHKDEVPGLMEARLRWLEAKRENPDYPTAILAGVAHFEVAEVHPFADYNGRTARLFAIAIFFREGFIARQLFSPERYYAEDKDAYIEALRSYKKTKNLNDWLAYYTLGLAEEFEKTRDRVQALNGLTQSLSLPVQLSTVQDRAIAELTAGSTAELRVGPFAQAIGVSRPEVSKALNKLAELGVLRASGQTRDRRFTLRQQKSAALATGRPKKWTEARIEAELREFVKQLDRWPRRKDFDEAGLMSLYVAMSRAEGGVEGWKSRLAP